MEWIMWKYYIVTVGYEVSWSGSAKDLFVNLQNSYKIM